MHLHLSEAHSLEVWVVVLHMVNFSLGGRESAEALQGGFLPKQAIPVS